MRIAILGNDSTHTYLFAKLILSHPYIEGTSIQLNSIWGDNDINNSILYTYWCMDESFGICLLENLTLLISLKSNKES